MKKDKEVIRRNKRKIKELSKYGFNLSKLIWNYVVLEAEIENVDPLTIQQQLKDEYQ